MKPIEFPEVTVTLAKNQPEYQPLPVYQARDPWSTVISCWQLEPEEIDALKANGGKLWLSQLTFGQPLQPQLPSVEKPQMRRSR